ncbi:Protein SUPPRESSOR OF PHYA-105 1 [Acorus gramineus]|uniref:Protein SUPPRESSOR OF PHYA-105 1 n=1 Tax=Acorus gramineus TaxID=55184 RepID=A0AAV9BGQ6_ACOGR|nr:Protein SUPPRESSOR OF PHYA-105 1 [Acorus gramineus]
MEAMGDINEAVEDTTEAPQLKRREREPSPPPTGINSLDSAAICASNENIWPESLAEALQVDVRCASSHGSEHLCTSLLHSLDHSDVVVEELMLRNHRVETTSRNDQRENLYRLAVETQCRSSHGDSSGAEPAPALGDREEARNTIPLPFWVHRPLPHKQSEGTHCRTHENVIDHDNPAAPSDAFTRFRGGIRTKVLPASGFSHFFIKDTLKEKAVAFRHSVTREMPGVAIRGLIKDKTAGDGTSWSSGAAENCETSKDILCSGISLREWLRSNSRRINRSDCLDVFRQVVEIVDSAHSQRVVLQNLRPSHLKLFPSNKVKYIGSVYSPGQMLLSESESMINDDTEHFENKPKRKVYLENHVGMHDAPSVKHQKLKENHRLVGQNSMFPAQQSLRGTVVEEISLNNFRGQNSGCDFRDSHNVDEEFMRCGLSGLPTESKQEPVIEITQLEERWYASPEELSEKELTFPSNIYSLGVLLFELFCFFGSSDGHAAAMKDLHHRILPPNFLSENPKEAGFCLWLLHPEPSSRPKTRDILKSDLLCESGYFSSVDCSSEFDEEDAEADLLLHFLLSLKEEKAKQAIKLTEDIGCLKADIEEVERRQLLRFEFLSNGKDALTSSNDVSNKFNKKAHLHEEPVSRLSTSNLNEERLMKNIKQLENAYFSMRSSVVLSESHAAARSDREVIKDRDGWTSAANDIEEQCTEKSSNDRLGNFFDGLCKYARYSKFEVRGVLRNGDFLNSANVICSLSFDRDEEYFAAAGVSKKIKIFEFDSLLKDSVDIHYPVIEMSSKSKLSCVCWNNYIKNYLASTDYDGIVQLWDAGTGQGFTQYAEHQRRAWSVDFSQVDPTRLASGGDDCSVKLWSINEQKCTDTIRNVANICCVQFSSHSTHLLAFGSADYKIYCYDLRNIRIPWCTLVGHEKAVSYVKFVDSQSLVSASTDGTLKLWDLNRTSSTGLSTDACSLTFTGHTNEKNFVGLTASDGYIACGSETNEVYAYYRSLPMPITSHKFGSMDSISSRVTSDDNGQFVSSVCWRGKSNMVVAANSSGSIKLLEMM